MKGMVRVTVVMDYLVDTDLGGYEEVDTVEQAMLDDKQALVDEAIGIDDVLSWGDIVDVRWDVLGG